MLTDKELAALDEAENKATPGQWHSHGAHVSLCPFEDRGAEKLWERIVEWAICSFPTGRNNRSVPKDDCDFIALARNNMRALIDTVKQGRQLHAADEEYIRKLKAELKAARNVLDYTLGNIGCIQDGSSTRKWIDKVTAVLKSITVSGLLVEGKAE